jgi:hypothetical protein
VVDSGIAVGGNEVKTEFVAFVSAFTIDAMRVFRPFRWLF